MLEKRSTLHIELCECIGQHAEMVRQKLEKMDIRCDIEAFISACGTGTEKPGMYLTAVLCFALPLFSSKV